MANPELPKEGEKLTRFQAQRRLGLFARWDITMLVAIASVWIVTGFYWWFKPEPVFASIIFSMLVSILLAISWLIVLVYRGLVWLLDIQADINLMPDAAARIVLGYYEGRKK
jgi:hypothetical protein